MKKHVTKRDYLVTFVALLVLTALSWVLAHVPLGDFELPIALVIALVKSGLVALFFMHLIEQRLSNRLTLLVSVTFLVIIIGFIAADVSTRLPTGVELPPGAIIPQAGAKSP